jgi:hypothetical protein
MSEDVVLNYITTSSTQHDRLLPTLCQLRGLTVLVNPQHRQQGKPGLVFIKLTLWPRHELRLRVYYSFHYFRGILGYL